MADNVILSTVEGHNVNLPIHQDMFDCAKSVIGDNIPFPAIDL